MIRFFLGKHRVITNIYIGDNMKLKVSLVLMIIVFNVQFKHIDASDTRLVNEVTSVLLNPDLQTIEIMGWAFIMDAQHYNNEQTHSYKLRLQSKNHTIEIYSKPYNISQTEVMSYYGSRRCYNNEYFIDASICNHDYNYVGFSFLVPVKDLRVNEDYSATIEVHAKQANIKKSVNLYYAEKNEVHLHADQKILKIESKLFDSKLKVMSNSVLVRKEPNKNAETLDSLSNCSPYKAHYKVNTIFNNILDKQIVRYNTYYQLKGRFSSCINQRSQVEAGNDLYPIWIASNFIERLGEPLTFKVRDYNTDPVITVSEHPVLYVGETFIPLKGVSAFDAEDGDLTSRIKISSNNYKDKPGVYQVEYNVTDSFRKKVTAIQNITVLKRNYPPSIIANDAIIEQYHAYDPYDFAVAIDQHQTDISHKLVAKYTIQTSKIGAFRQCYEVIDDANLKSEACSNVEIVFGKKSFRFIHPTKIFYMEDIPIMWHNRLDIINEAITNDIVFNERKLSR